jgi:hypothetical protein
MASVIVPLMRGGKSRVRSGAQKRNAAVKTSPKFMAWLILALLACLGSVLLWFGLAVVVRCDRVHEDRVDVTVERRFLGWLTITRETIQDVIGAAAVSVTSRRSSGYGSSSNIALALTPRHGTEWRLGPGTPSIGTHPKNMAPQIEQFIKEPFGRSLILWRMPWLINLGAVLFLLFPVMTAGEVLLRALGVFKREADPSRDHS